MSGDEYLKRLQEWKLEVKVDSELWIGQGMGSSASYLGAFLSAWLKLHKELLNWEGLINQQVEVLLQQLECVFHGKASGVDTKIVSEGGCGVFRLDEKREGMEYEALDLQMVNQQYMIYIIDTGVLKNTKQAVLYVQQHHHPHTLTQLAHLTHQLITFITNTTNNNTNNNNNNNNNNNINWGEFEELVKQNHVLLNSLGLNTKQSDEINEICSGFDISCKITGAGQGGLVLALVPRSTPPHTLTLFHQQLHAHHYLYRHSQIYYN